MVYMYQFMLIDMRFALNYLEFIRLLRFETFVRYTKNFTEAFAFKYITYKVILLVNAIVVYFHMVACCFMVWTIYDVHYDRDRFIAIISSEVLASQANFKATYIRFLYGVCLMSMSSDTIDFPVRPATLIYTICMIGVSKVLLYVTIAYVVDINEFVASPYLKYLDMVSELRDFVRHRRMPPFLEDRILAFYDIEFQGCYFQEAEILETVSSQLRQVNKKLVESVTFFKDLPLPLLIRIVSCLRNEIFLTNDVIVKAGTSGECMYFISCGTVTIYTKIGKEICHLEDGEYFGEICLTTAEATRVATVVAADVCELYRLDRKDFVRAIQPYPDLYNKIISVAGERTEMTANVAKIEEMMEQNKWAKF